MIVEPEIGDSSAVSGPDQAWNWFPVTIAALCVTAVLVGAWLFYQSEKDKIRSRVEAELIAISELKAGQIIQWRNERLADARFFSRAEFVARNVQALLANPDSPMVRAETLDWLTRLKSGDRYEQVALFDARHNIRLMVPAPSEEPAPALRAEVAAVFLTNDVVMTDLHRSHPTNSIHLNVLFPVFAPGSVSTGAAPSNSARQPPIAVVVLRLNPRQFLNPLVKSWPLPSPTGEAALVRREGDRVLFVTDVRHVPNSTLSLSFPINQPDLPAALALRGQEGMVEGNDYRGVPVVSVFRRIPRSPWFLGVKVDQAEIYAPLRTEPINIGVAALALARAALGGLGWPWRGREARFLRREVAAGRALHASEQRYRRLFEDATEGVALADAETGEILDCNRAFLLLSGYEHGELIGKAQSLLHPKTGSAPAVWPAVEQHPDPKPGAVLLSELVTKSGQRKHVEIKANDLELGGRKVRHAFFRDVTAELRYQRERETSLKLLRLLNDHDHTRELLRSLTGFLREWTGCEAVGVRLREGDDFPYFETRGFPPEFVEAENQLCARDERGQLARDAQGHPLLECMCGNVLCGRFNPALPHFTSNGSFWTNSTTALLAATTQADRQVCGRNRCHADGYESVALIPLRFGGQTLGLVQLNDPARGRFTPDLIRYLEEAAGQIAIALAQRQTQAELRQSEAKYRLVSENTADVIWLYDLETSRFTYVSPSVQRLCGVTPEQARRQAMEDVLTPASLQVMAAQLPARIAALEAGDESARVQTHEVQQLRRDGSMVPTEVVTTLLQNESGRVIRLIGVSRDISERHRAELALRQSQAELAAIHDHAPIVMMLLDKDRQVRRLNRAALAFLKRPDAPAGGMRPGDVLGCLHALDDPRGCGHGKDCAHCPLRLTMLDTLTTGASHQRVEVQPGLAAGKATRKLTMLASTARLSVEGEPMLLLCLEDITDRRRLESQFRQAQKMEAIGQLAGGVAHDFNNILTGILIELGMLKDHPQLAESLNQPIDELERAANRAAALTRQLLLFSRREVMQARPVNLNELLDNMLKMLRRLLGEHITVNFQSQVDLPQVEADTGMIEQVVMNLCVNARDAMPQGGRLALAVKPVQIEAAEATRHPDARAGRFVCLSVEDTGCGMNETVQARIFEPFFTTKEVGRGTGLGLATVFGIVQQHQGWIEVSSKVGQGSTFSVYLPAFAGPAAAAPRVAETARLRGGEETILVVEDEAGVRQLARMVLQRQGYAVVEAANGPEALRLWAQHRERIDLLFADMVMPEGMTGQELAGRLRADNPDLKVILSSGYSAELIEGAGWKIKDAVYLPKPYSLASLARVVRECLDQ